jgi:DNA-binding transcriptional MocR family regulator
MKDMADWNRDMEYGMCWLKMKPGINLDKMLATKKDITFIPASFFESVEHRHIYLSPCCMTEEELEYGIRALSELARSCMNK